MWVIAHRGASGHAPENTLAAFRRAVELGASYIETDLHLTRDARLVAIHDSTLDRTTTGQGEVHLHTLQQIRALDAGSWFQASSSESFAGEQVPTLEEILDFAAEQDIGLFLEIKSGGAWGIERALAAALRDRAVAGVVVLSFDAGLLDSIHRLNRSVMTGWLCEHPAPDLVERAIHVGARQLAPRSDLVTSTLVQQAHQEGLKVVTWTVNDPEQMCRLADTKVDGIMSDYPDRLVQALGKTGPLPDA